MRTALPRIATVVVAMLAFSPTSARAETWASCGPSSKVVIEPTNIDGSYPNGVLLDDSQAPRIVVCFAAEFANTGSGAIVISPVGGGGTPPSVTPGTDLAACPGSPIISNSTLHVALQLGLSTTTVCLRIGSTPKTLTFAAGSGYTPPTLSVQVWRSGNWSTLDVLSCPVDYALYQFGDGGDTCMNGGPQRII